MEFSDSELEKIKKQLSDYQPDSPIEKIALGWIDEIESLAELKLHSTEEGPITLYVSKKYVKERGLNQGKNKFFALIEYTSNSGQKLEIVRL